MTPPTIPVGFDYALALLRIREHMTYEQIAEVCGFSDKQSIGRVVNEGLIPNHPQGEAIFAVYVELFQQKPPMQEVCRVGIANVALARRRNRVLAV